MAIGHVVTRGFGNGTFVGEIRQIVSRGFFDSAVPPILDADIDDILLQINTGNHQFDLSVNFLGETSYAISPAVEAGWSFNTNTGVLVVDTDDADDFGPYIVTASNSAGDVDSNAFSVSIFSISYGSGTTRRGMSLGMKFGM